MVVRRPGLAAVASHAMTSRMHLRAAALVLAVASAAAFGGIGCTQKDGGPVAAARAGCPKGQRDCLPDLTYIDTTGAAYPRDALIGKVVLVNFWATWCAPCEKEIPDLSKAYVKYKAKGVVFLGVLIDNPDSQALLNFQSDHDMQYPVVRANRDLMASYNNPDAYPTTLVYDRSGKQVYSHLGVVRDTELDTLLSNLSAQN
jgi:thiol-disulfide isomerase/thioredoxin